MTKIIVIQNTHYHFETLISVYQTLKELGYSTLIYTCDNITKRFKQEEFFSKYKLELASIDDILDSDAGIVISAFPNPYVSYENAIPNEDDIIFSLLSNKLIYISHRFKYAEDYMGNKFTPENSICLSPLSLKIGINYINLVNCPIVPEHTNNDSEIKFTIQAHFELTNRDLCLFEQIIHLMNKYTHKNILLNIIGTKTEKIFGILRKKNTVHFKCQLYDSVSEETFYTVLNQKTDWIIPLITPDINNQTYILERYSSNFNHAVTLEKPIFAHQVFENVYNIPGIYYDSNILSKFEQVVYLKTKEYTNLVQKFATEKEKMLIHNKHLMTTIIDKCLKSH